MRIAFYAPMKPPEHPLASGDRTMARLLVAALRRRGHSVETACRLRSHDPSGDRSRQRRIEAIGRHFGRRLARRWQQPNAAGRPDLWFTYHLYHKAPDWLGPWVATALGIPYVVAEASHAGKQAAGAWADGFAAAAAAIAAADLVVALNPADVEGIRPLLAAPDRLLLLAPFVDTAPYARATAASRHDRRRRLLARAGRPEEVRDGVPLLLTVAMMRDGAKRASYRLLGEALTMLGDRPWHLLVAGDGPARDAVGQVLAGPGEHRGDRVSLLGHVGAADLAAIYAGADLLVWPAVGEAWGMSLIEAQAAGLPVVAGRAGGIPSIVADGETGLLSPEGDATAFAAAVAALLDDVARRQRMAAAAAQRAAARHDIGAASRTLDAALRRLTGTRRSGA